MNIFVSGVIEEVEKGSGEALFDKVMQARRR